MRRGKATVAGLLLAAVLLPRPAAADEGGAPTPEVPAADAPATDNPAPLPPPPETTFDPSDPGYPDHPYGLGQIGRDTRYIVTRPAHLDRNGVIKVALTVGTTALLYLYREDIRDWAQDHRSESRDQFLQNVRTMGKGAFAPTLALIAYGSSFLTDNAREKETAVLLLESMGFAALGTGVCQSVLASERPEDGTNVDFFARRGHGCSGDAALAASVVPILSRQYLVVGPEDSGARRFWKLGGASLLYAGAFLTGYQRINDDKHWAPDVFLGLVVGFSMGQMLEDSHQATRESTRRSTRLGVGPGEVSIRFQF